MKGVIRACDRNGHSRNFRLSQHIWTFIDARAPKHFREAGHNYSFSASVFSEFDVLVQAKEVLRVVLLLYGQEPVVVGTERSFDRVHPLVT